MSLFQQQVSVSTSEAVSFGNTFRARPTISPSVNLVNKQSNRQQVRTRVRRPPPASSDPVIPVLEEEGPPRFALDSDEAIQRFRESVSFGPSAAQSDQQDGRLTFLSTANIRQQQQQQPSQVPPPRRSFESQQAPIKSFAAVPAVPETQQNNRNICCIFSPNIQFKFLAQIWP